MGQIALNPTRGEELHCNTEACSAFDYTTFWIISRQSISDFITNFTLNQVAVVLRVAERELSCLKQGWFT